MKIKEEQTGRFFLSV